MNQKANRFQICFLPRRFRRDRIEVVRTRAHEILLRLDFFQHDPDAELLPLLRQVEALRGGGEVLTRGGDLVRE